MKKLSTMIITKRFNPNNNYSGGGKSTLQLFSTVNILFSIIRHLNTKGFFDKETPFIFYPFHETMLKIFNKSSVEFSKMK